MMMIEMNVSQNMLDKAQKASDKLGVLRNSISQGRGNKAGYVGEYCVMDYLLNNKHDVVEDNTYDYDFYLNTKNNGKLKIDVKTKTTGVKPLNYYDCSIAEYNTKQKCDVYVFTRILYSLKKIWLLGWLPKQEYFNKSTFLKKGTVDEDNGYKVKASCYNLKIDELNLMENL